MKEGGEETKEQEKKVAKDPKIRKEKDKSLKKRKKFRSKKRHSRERRRISVIIKTPFLLMPFIISD